MYLKFQNRIMKPRIAILIVGEPNSGKTTTINFFDFQYDENEKMKKQCRKGWRHLQLFKGSLWAEFTLMCFSPSNVCMCGSPFERP